MRDMNEPWIRISVISDESWKTTQPIPGISRPCTVSDTASVNAHEADSTPKIFAHMGLLIVIIGISHAVTNQIYMNIVFDQFRMQEIDAGYLSATPSEQIEILKTYVIDRMKWIGPGKGVFILLIGLFFSLWISGY